MAKININTAEVRKQSKLLKEASSTLLSGSVKPIEDANKHLASIWTGQSAQSFIKYTDQLASYLKSNAADINEISVFLNKACLEMERAEQQARAKIK